MKKIFKLLPVIIVLGFSRYALSSQESFLTSQIEELTSQYSSVDVENAVLVRDLENSKVIYTKNADLLLNPASNTKIFTTLAALSLLGSNYQFPTQLLGNGDSSRGHLSTLILKGFGDPTFTNERLEDMVAQLKAKGVTSVDKVIIDDTYFDTGNFPGRLDGRQKDAPFNATVDALAVDHNVLKVIVQPAEKAGKKAEVLLSPPLPNFPIEGEVITGGKRGRVIVRNCGKGSEDPSISVSGSIPAKAHPQIFLIGENYPSQVMGMLFLSLLQTHRIQAPQTPSFGPTPDKSKVLIESLSEPLALILQEINKKSDNFMAEQVTKALGAKLGGIPGSTEKGVEAIQKQLKTLGIDLKDITLENGSGLSYRTRVKVKNLADVLQKAYEDNQLHQDFISSLSVLGVDGTLKRKFRGKELEGMFVGKTGTLNGVTALSGYVFRRSAPDRPPFIFSFIANGAGKMFWQQRQLQEKILELLINQ